MCVTCYNVRYICAFFLSFSGDKSGRTECGQHSLQGNRGYAMDFSRLASFIDNIEEICGIPNCDISVYREHEEIFRRSSGFTDLERTKRPTDQDLYRLYSASKVSLAVMILQLAEQGKLRLDDPVSMYLSEMAGMMVKEGDELVPCRHQATIEDFLAMQGGLNYDTERKDIRDLVEARPEATTREIISQWLMAPLVYEPGTRYLYSMSHDVLGAVVEVVTGKRLSEYIREAIADPLGMQDLDYNVKEEKKHRMVQQYLYRPEEAEKLAQSELVPLDPFYNLYILGENYECAGAGLITRVSDYVLLADALANDGVGATGNRILTRESIDNMRRSRLDTPIKKADYRKMRDFGYGYGLGVRTLVRPETSCGPVGEFGWDGYAGVFLLSDVDNRVSMFFAMSVGEMDPVKHIHHKIRDLMYEGYLR